jgi:hypothetical protein
MVVDGAPVVIDFGIAHAVDATRLTRLGQVVGTPGYMGPEIIEGAPPSPAADVYGWATTVTFAATGRSPYGSGSLDAVLARVATGRPELDGVPPSLEPLVRAALERDPARRPSAADLVRRIRPADAGAPPTRPERRRPPLGIYKALAYLSVLAAAGLCAVLPVLAGAGTLALAWYLRAGDAAVRRRRVPVRTAADLVLAPARAGGARVRAGLALPFVLLYAGLSAAVVAALLVVWGWHGGPTAPETTARPVAFAFAYVVLAGPRMMAPRRQLVRLLSALAPGRRAVTETGLVLAVLTVMVAAGAWELAPHWWPLRAPYPVPGRWTDLLSRLR